jgi:hypothetical protein
MKTLPDILLATHHKDALVQDCAQLFDSHISNISGLKGMAIKASWGMIKSAKANLPERAARRMLPDLAQALDPLFQKFKTSSDGDFGVFLSKNADEAGSRLLTVTDGLIATSQVNGVKQAWNKFRSTAESEMTVLAPKLGKLLANYLS